MLGVPCTIGEERESGSGAIDLILQSTGMGRDLGSVFQESGCEAG